MQNVCVCVPEGTSGVRACAGCCPQSKETSSNAELMKAHYDETLHQSVIHSTPETDRLKFSTAITVSGGMCVCVSVCVRFSE